MILAIAAAAAGLSLMVAASVLHRRENERVLDELLGASALMLEQVRADEEVSPLTVKAVGLAAQVVERVDRKRSLGQLLEKAKVPLRPGEFLIVQVGAALAAGALVLGVTHSWVASACFALVAPVGAVTIVRRRIGKRRKAFEEQLPDALALIASSLSAGHTFLRAIQMMCEEAGPPMSEEFARVVVETRLGDPVVVALDRMAERLEIRDLDMVAQAIRIQQTVGGRLADLLHTLSDFIRARDEVRREVKVLTAEGRMSAYVLTALVPFLFGVMQTMNPTYTAPLYHGWGMIVLFYAAGSVLTGMFVILRMVRIDI